MTSESLHQMKCLEFFTTLIRQEVFESQTALKALSFCFRSIFFEKIDDDLTFNYIFIKYTNKNYYIQLYARTQ